LAFEKSEAEEAIVPQL